MRTALLAGLAAALLIPPALSFAAPPRAGSEGRAERAASLPDWSGVWRPLNGPVFDAAPGAAPSRDHPPFKPAFEARYVATMARLKADPKADPLSECLPLGALRMMSLGGLHEFAVTPEQVLIFAESAPKGPASVGAQVRRIYTDGRKQLAGDDLFPTFTGNSIGRWEGDTLAVRTVGLRDDLFIDRTGAMLSGDAVIEERIRLVAPGVLQDRFTITDRTALTRPWTVTRRWRRAPSTTEIVDDACNGHSVNPAAFVDAAAKAPAR